MGNRMYAKIGDVKLKTVKKLEELHTKAALKLSTDRGFVALEIEEQRASPGPFPNIEAIA